MHMCCEQPWRKMTTSKQGPTLYHGSSNELHSKILLGWSIFHHGQYILSVVQTDTSSWVSSYSDIWLIPFLFLSSSDSQFDGKVHKISRDWISVLARISKYNLGENLTCKMDLQLPATHFHYKLFLELIWNIKKKNIIFSPWQTQESRR